VQFQNEEITKKISHLYFITSRKQAIATILVEDNGIGKLMRKYQSEVFFLVYTKSYSKKCRNWIRLYNGERGCLSQMGGKIELDSVSDEGKH